MSSRRLALRGILALAGSALTAMASPAQASDPLNSSDKPTKGEPADASVSRNDFNIFPVAGGTTDIGIGGGYFAGLAHLRKGYDPYVWNLESAGFVTFKYDDKKVSLPYQDVYLQLTVPRILDAPMRLELKAEYSAEATLMYTGLGDHSPPQPSGVPTNLTEYGRTHPEVVAAMRWKFIDHLSGLVGLSYVQNWLQVASGSKLAEDLATGSPEVKALLGTTGPHAVASLVSGVEWDNRESEVSTHSGSLHTFNVKLSPGGTAAFPYRYGHATLISRVFIPVWRPRVTLAARVVGDVYFGDTPFYELARFDDTYLGGVNGIRGVPAERYYGKAKVFGNLEMRTEIVSFKALGKPMLFGFVAFLDGGRVWADLSPHPELDGTGIGLKYGVGGGLRLLSGSAFVLRGDLAWSPDASPVGAYLAVGEMF